MSPADSDFEGGGFDEFDSATTTEVPQITPRAPVYRKQGFSIYSFLLILSFVFLLISIILLFIEVGRFD